MAELSATTPLPFGKFKGLTLEQVGRVKGGGRYLVWWHRNVVKAPLPVSVLTSVCGHWDTGEDDDGPDEFGGMSYDDFGNN